MFSWRSFLLGLTYKALRAEWKKTDGCRYTKTGATREQKVCAPYKEFHFQMQLVKTAHTSLSAAFHFRISNRTVPVLSRLGGFPQTTPGKTGILSNSKSKIMALHVGSLIVSIILLIMFVIDHNVGAAFMCAILIMRDIADVIDHAKSNL